MKEHVVIMCDPLLDHHIAKISEAIKGWGTWERIGSQSSREEVQAGLRNATIVMGALPPKLLKQTPVHTVLLSFVGFESFEGIDWDTDHAGLPFTLCNAKGVMGIQMAEHALAMMFGLTRKLPQDIRSMEKRHWQKKHPYAELDDTVACLIGIGDIGSEMARRFKANGMYVIGVRREEKPHEWVDEVYSISNLHQALQKADHVIMITPGGAQTKHLIGSEAFEAMKDGAYFYNLGRGSTVDEQALIKALQSGKLGGAGLDVFEQEPLPKGSPLWDMENVIVTPHVAGRSTREYDRMCDLFVENLNRYKKGETLKNIVAHKGEHL